MGRSPEVDAGLTYDARRREGKLERADVLEIALDSERRDNARLRAENAQLRQEVSCAKGR